MVTLFLIISISITQAFALQDCFILAKKFRQLQKPVVPLPSYWLIFRLFILAMAS